jgi:serine/threonine protein phosphatase PrpC
VLGSRLGRYGVWWTQGSERVASSVLIATELPDPEAFTAMLDGRWQEHGWTSADSSAAGGYAAEHAVAFRSAGVSGPGKIRSANEDSYATHDGVGAWIVADGLGGHQAGDVASGMVASVLEQLAEDSDLDERINELVRALTIVNGCLQVMAERDPTVTLVGSTVAALLADGAGCACIWAGDSRVYRLRDGQLEQLSRDHSEHSERAGEGHAVTRAVGGAGALELEIARGDVCDGDRYLLCTDGLYDEVPAEAIASALLLADPAQSCARLQQATLHGAARDNFTAVVVHATATQTHDAPGR